MSTASIARRQRKSRSVVRSAAAAQGRTEGPVDGCPLCDDPLETTSRLRHLREQHPAYWRTFVVRIGSPWLFLALMLGLAVAGGPAWSFMAVLLGFVGLSLWARRRSITERGRPGKGLTRAQWLQGLGVGLVLMSLSLVVLAVVFTIMP